MFSTKEKMMIAEAIEKLLLDLNHPEMPKSKPKFTLHVEGAESWSWAHIEPNWMFENESDKAHTNEWNEAARELLGKPNETMKSNSSSCTHVGYGCPYFLRTECEGCEYFK